MMKMLTYENMSKTFIFDSFAMVNRGTDRESNEQSIPMRDRKGRFYLSIPSTDAR